MWSYLRRRAWRLRTVPLFSILLASDCSSCSDTTSTASLASAAIAGTLVVTVQTSGGIGIGAAVVKLLGTSIGAVANSSGVATIIAAADDYQVQALYLGCAPATQNVTIPAGGSVSITIALTCDTFDAVNDLASPTSLRIWLLDYGSDASGSAVCVNDALVQSTGLQALDGNATPTDESSASCHLGALVLAVDRAPFYSNTISDFSWTSGFGDVFSPAMPADKLEVPIRIILSDPSLTGTARTNRKSDIEAADLELATLALNDSYAGITLVDEAGGPPTIQDADDVATLLSGGCASVPQIRMNTTIYSQGRLNIYYVKEVKNEEGGEKAGYNCVTSDAPEIMFIDHDGHFTSHLAHEIGHALGLITPFWGHGDYYEGFYEDTQGRRLNVMVDGTPTGTETLPIEARYFSVGQVSRMHLSDASWLNKPSAPTMTTLRARKAMPAADIIVPCGCPETAATPDCAAVNRDIDRTTPDVTARPANAPNFYFTCRVVATAPTAVSVCVGKTVQAEAGYFQGTNPGTGPGTLWVSMNPTIVKAVSASPPPGNVMTGDLTGLAVGNATVRAYADGAFATFTVTVTPPC